MATSEKAVRAYLGALADPASLRDDEAIAQTSTDLASESDPITRLKLQQQMAELSAPSMEGVEDDFVMHGKAWAEDMGISGNAFAAEGVPAAVLRRAGFAVGKARSGKGRSGGSAGRRSARVTTEEVISAMPSGSFTVKMLKEASGASPAVVRKAIAAEVAAGNLAEAGADPDHSGPGRAPTLYRRG